MSGRRLQQDVLRGVSRSFYLSIRVLPVGMREPVAVAYLLARTADTIADTRALPPRERLSRLSALHSALVVGDAGGGMREWPDAQTVAVSEGEAELLQRIGGTISLFNSLPERDRGAVRSVVSTLMEGMRLDLETFPAEDAGEQAALGTPEELDRYTYLVAGCVGEFWTTLSLAHSRGLRGWEHGEMAELGVRFGKALQLTNVLRDVPRDLRNGRCYLPQSDLEAAGLAPADLLDPTNYHRARPVLLRWLRTTLEHYDCAGTYLLAIPRRCVRLRLAALWPILLGLATLRLLARNEGWLDPATPSRVRRRWVYGMLARSVPLAPSDGMLRAWIGHLRRDVERALHGA